jgi:hypothetical protein
VEILPVLPDFALWQHPLALGTFENDPLEDLHDVLDTYPEASRQTALDRALLVRFAEQNLAAPDATQKPRAAGTTLAVCLPKDLKVTDPTRWLCPS